jgi:hypothetical protein
LFRARLEEEVVGQVLDQITRAEDVVSVPRAALRVLRKRALAAGEEVMWIAYALDVSECGLRCAPVVDRTGAGEHRVDRRGDQLDVAELLSRNRRHEVVKRAGTLPRPEIEGLKRVVEPRRHLTELPAEEFLNGLRAGRIRVGRWR